MRIHKDQREAFDQHARELVPHRVRAILLDKLPERRAELEGAKGLARVEAAVARAREQGFVFERDAARFVALGYVLGEGFASEPWAAEVLADPRLETPTERIETLWEAAKDRALEEAATSVAKAMR